MSEALREAIDQLLAEDPDTLSDAELHDTVVELQRQTARLAAARARFVSAWERRLLWADDGSKAPAARLGRECGLSRLITVLVGYETLAGRICELADGTVISPGQVLPLLAEADIERVVFDGPSRVIEVGVRRRFFTGALRRAIEVRDRHCTHPSGCEVPVQRCQVDHIVPYAEGGLTTQDNGRLHCPVHNRRRVSERRRAPPSEGEAA